MVTSVAVAACGGSSGTRTPAPSASGDLAHVSTLDRAVEGVNVTRNPLVQAMNDVIVAANHVDAIDGASAPGDWKRAQQARRRNPVDPVTVDDLINRMPSLVRAYSAALGALSAAAGRGDVPVRVSAAVDTVVRAGRAEVDADGVFLRGIAQAWPAYAVLAGTQTLWFERASGDWYDGHKQAAQEYSVLTAPLRTTTNDASDQFGRSDVTRRAAADQWAATLEEVHPILYPPK
jgi:hypothetical protein